MKEFQYGNRVGFSLQIVGCIASHGFDARSSLRVWIEHYTAQEVEIKRIRFGCLIVGKERNLCIAIVGFSGEYIAIDVESLFVVAMLIVEIS